jgi:hypothetical protein
MSTPPTQVVLPCPERKEYSLYQDKKDMMAEKNDPPGVSPTEEFLLLFMEKTDKYIGQKRRAGVLGACRMPGKTGGN